MTLSDTKLRSKHGKPYSGPAEISDADGLSVRISPKGVILFQYRYIGRIRDSLDIGYWRAHDFRRTLVTRLSEQGTAPHVTEWILGMNWAG